MTSSMGRDYRRGSCPSIDGQLRRRGSSRKLSRDEDRADDMIYSQQSIMSAMER